MTTCRFNDPMDPPWRDYDWLPDIVMIPLDPVVNEIDLEQITEEFAVAQGSETNDERGTRQATLLFPQGVQAEMVLPDGSTQPLTSLDVRITEYTVGENGPETMPAPLPPQVGYTYAIELSVDEALEAGASTVTFNEPLIHYTDNFLEFPAGTSVPVGIYDRDIAQWVPSESGVVIKIVSITA